VLGKSQVHITPKRIIEALGPAHAPHCRRSSSVGLRSAQYRPGGEWFDPTVARLRIFEPAVIASQSRVGCAASPGSNGSRSCTTDIATRDLNPRRSCEGENKTTDTKPPVLVSAKPTGLWCRIYGWLVAELAQLPAGATIGQVLRHHAANGEKLTVRILKDVDGPVATTLRFSCSRCRPGAADIVDRRKFLIVAEVLYHRLLRYRRTVWSVVSHGCGGALTAPVWQLHPGHADGPSATNLDPRADQSGLVQA
jgi:hypothetical protein